MQTSWRAFICRVSVWTGVLWRTKVPEPVVRQRAAFTVHLYTCVHLTVSWWSVAMGGSQMSSICLSTMEFQSRKWSRQQDRSCSLCSRGETWLQWLTWISTRYSWTLVSVAIFPRVAARCRPWNCKIRPSLFPDQTSCKVTKPGFRFYDYFFVVVSLYLLLMFSFVALCSVR